MPTRKTKLSAVLVLTGVLLLTCPLSAVDYGKDIFKTDENKAAMLAEKIPATEVLGPLAPVALSPFFGITCLSGSSMLVQKGVLPENSFLQGSDVLSNPAVFMTFLALTILTSVPKLSTASKFFAEATDQVETYAGIISYAVIFMLAAGGTDSEVAIVFKAGIVSFGRNTLLIIALTLNIIVINTVKYFFELLILISPIPLIDAIFEAANKTFAAGLAAVYAFSPGAAFALNVVIFLICLVFFNYARKQIRYFRNIVVSPVLVKMFSIQMPHNRSHRAVQSLLGGGESLFRCFPGRRFGKISKKSLCYLVEKDEQLLLVKPRIIRGPLIEPISGAYKMSLKKGLISNSLILESGTEKTVKLIFSKSYNHDLPEIAYRLEVDIDDAENSGDKKSDG